MADKNPPPKRWIIVKLFQHAIERTEAEIAELKGGGLFVRDAPGPGDVQVAAPTTPPPGSPPSGAKPDIKE